MYTLEDKINLCMAYIAVDDEVIRAQAKAMIVKALKETGGNIKSTQAAESMTVDKVIDDVLKEIGVPCHLCGYDRMACAVRLIVLDNTYRYQITKRLYPDVAKQCDTTPSRVERAIRHATEVVFNNGNMELLERIFGNSISCHKGKPTNQHMLVHCARVVKDRMELLGVEV